VQAFRIEHEFFVDFDDAASSPTANAQRPKGTVETQ